MRQIIENFKFPEDEKYIIKGEKIKQFWMIERVNFDDLRGKIKWTSRLREKIKIDSEIITKRKTEENLFKMF